MPDAVPTPDALKRAMKEALLETFAEHRDELRALLADVVEDLAFGEAMREGEQTPPVSRERIFDLLGDPS